MIFQECTNVYTMITTFVIDIFTFLTFHCRLCISCIINVNIIHLLLSDSKLEVLNVDNNFLYHAGDQQRQEECC